MILIPVLSFLEEVKKMRSVPAMPTSERERERVYTQAHVPGGWQYTHLLLKYTNSKKPEFLMSFWRIWKMPYVYWALSVGQALKKVLTLLKILFNSPNNPMRKGLLLSLPYRCATEADTEEVTCSGSHSESALIHALGNLHSWSAPRFIPDTG